MKWYQLDIAWALELKMNGMQLLYEVRGSLFVVNTKTRKSRDQIASLHVLQADGTLAFVHSKGVFCMGR